MKVRRDNLQRYRTLLSPYRWQIGVVFALSVVSACVMVIQPYLYHYAIDDIALKPTLTLAQRLTRLVSLLSVMLGFIVVAGVANYWQGYRSAALNSVITARLRHRVLKHMLQLPLNTLITMKTGGAAARLNNDTAAVSQIVSRGLIVPGVAIIQVLAALTMLFVVNWRLSLGALTVISGTGYLSQRFAKRLRPLFSEIATLGNELSSRSNEMFGGVRVTRLYGREVAERRAYARMYHQVIRKTLSARRTQLAIDTFTGLSFALIQVVIISLGVYLIVYGRATVGDIFAVVIYSNRIMGPVEQLIQVYHQLQEDLASMDRIYDVLDMKTDKFNRPNAMHAPTKVTSVSFENVGFCYNGTSRNALSNIELYIPGGKTVALVGRSGAGKSTLTDLLSRFYEPGEGVIRLNGYDVRDIELGGYRRLFGLVQQDTFLFDGTVRDNIAYGAPQATYEDIVTAAKRANAHEFIVKLPQSYDTVIGERGIRLSGGQRQRISMARAFLVDPEILILDEATSSLDTENEQVIQQAMKELLRDRTTLIIAHRLSTVTHADTIIVLDEGRIQEMGTHEQLLARQGLYSSMIQLQHGQLIPSEQPAGLGV